MPLRPGLRPRGKDGTAKTNMISLSKIIPTATAAPDKKATPAKANTSKKRTTAKTAAKPKGVTKKASPKKKAASKKGAAGANKGKGSGSGVKTGKKGSAAPFTKEVLAVARQKWGQIKERAGIPKDLPFDTWINKKNWVSDENPMYILSNNYVAPGSMGSEWDWWVKKQQKGVKKGSGKAPAKKTTKSPAKKAGKVAKSPKKGTKSPAKGAVKKRKSGK